LCRKAQRVFFLSEGNVGKLGRTLSEKSTHAS